MSLKEEIQKRRTFAIISHPDAGKTTLTEKLLLYGGAINLAGTVKGRKATRHATSDWMALEQARGISVTTSVMQFLYENCVFNLLDTPGHEDFSEDTYRTLTAVDSALMVIDVAKGVEPRTEKLMEVCRLRATPIMTFINKCDREGLSPIDLLDHIESTLSLPCTPMTWPIGSGKDFCGVYDFAADTVLYYPEKSREKLCAPTIIKGIKSDEAQNILADKYANFLDEIELVQGASHPFNIKAYLKGEQTPVYFGAAINSIGVNALLSGIAKYAPAPDKRATQTREVLSTENDFTGFVFKIQANMDPNHRDRIAFLRVCSGVYHPGIKLNQVRLKRQTTLSNAVTFMAGGRARSEKAYPGDIIGLHNHGTISTGDTFTQGEKLKFTGIPHFAPDLFRRVILSCPLKSKALLKGLMQLSEEGATQIFCPLKNNDLILGAVGVLQFDVVAFRLQSEYKAACKFEPMSLAAARWVSCDNEVIFEQFQEKYRDNLAKDHHGALVYLAPTRVNLSLAQERFPKVQFLATKTI